MRNLRKREERLMRYVDCCLVLIKNFYKELISLLISTFRLNMPASIELLIQSLKRLTRSILHSYNHICVFEFVGPFDNRILGHFAVCIGMNVLCTYHVNYLLFFLNNHFYLFFIIYLTTIYFINLPVIVSLSFI